MTEASYTVFRATSCDTELARQAFEEAHERLKPDLSAIAAFLNDRTCYLLLAVTGTQVVGSLNGYALREPSRLEPQFLLYEIDVRPDWRRRGIGESLVNAFIHEARAAAAWEVWVVTNESTKAAIEVYKKCGFRRENSDDAMLSINLQSQ